MSDVEKRPQGQLALCQDSQNAQEIHRHRGACPALTFQTQVTMLSRTCTACPAHPGPAHGASHAGEDLQVEPGSDPKSFWDVFEAGAEGRGPILKRADRSMDTGDSFRAVVLRGAASFQFLIRCPRVPC